MEESLWSSVRALLGDGEPADLALSGPEAVPQRTTPLDFGAYFDLALPYPGGQELSENIKNEARSLLADKLLFCVPSFVPKTNTKLRPPVTTLSATHYQQSEIDRFLRWWDIEPENSLDLACISEQELHQASRLIQSAFEHLLWSAPELHDEILEIVDEIVVARPSGSQRLDFSGVSSFALWGAIGLNCEANTSWPYCFRTIVHEAAHNLLFAIARSEPLVANDPNERGASPLRDDQRPLDGIYHAAYVSARESLALDRLLTWHEETCLLRDSDTIVVQALFESSVIAFWECVETLRREAHLTSLGEEILLQSEHFMRSHFALVIE